MSRQSDYQRKKIAAGLCSMCGAEPLAGSRYGKKCQLKVRLRKRKAGGYKKWAPGHQGRIPLDLDKIPG